MFSNDWNIITEIFYLKSMKLIESDNLSFEVFRRKLISETHREIIESNNEIPNHAERMNFHQVQIKFYYAFINGNGKEEKMVGRGGKSQRIVYSSIPQET